MSNLVITRGVDNVFSVVIAKGGAPVDLTAATLRFFCRLNFSDAEADALIKLEIGSGIAVTLASAGDAEITILAAQTALLDVTQNILHYTLVMNEGLGDEVVDSGTLSLTSDQSSRFYIQIPDVRAEGLSADDFPDNKVLAYIKTWQQFLERACRQWFYPLDLVLNLDGSGSDSLHFGVPCIAITELQINASGNILDPSYYRVYNNLSAYPADRQNPRVKLIDSFEGARDIYTAPLRDGKMLFRKGRQNQLVKGTFGYIESDGTCPELIKRALLKLVVQKLTTPLFTPAGTFAPPAANTIRGPITAEWTDTHKIAYAPAGGTILAKAPGLNGITDDQEILTIIKLYKAPIGLATPNAPSYV